MYDIGIPEIICTKRYEDVNGFSLKYDAEAVERPETCPYADSDIVHNEPRLHVHSSQQNLIRDTRAEGKLVFINLTVKRYRCSECGRIISDKFTFYDKHSHMTHRLRNEFVRRCINGETFSYIARDYGVDHKTVAAAFKAYANEKKEDLSQSYTPEVLGIDETHVYGQFRLVLTDVKQQKLLDIKEDNSQDTTKAYLRTLDRTLCKCATMDFAPVYAKAVSDILPDTTIVIDKFHVVQEINRCLDNVRKDLQNEYRAQGVNIRRFKKSRTLFMTNWEDLTEKSIEALDSWFKEFPELYEAYLCKETLRDIYLTAESYEEAEKMFNLWIKAIPSFERFSPMKKTMISRRQHILNFWYYKWTNAYTESVNNLIKKIEEAGRGYKFETLRERCLLGINRQNLDKFDPRTAEYRPSDEIVNENETMDKKKELYVSMDTNPNEISDIPLKECVALYLELESSEEYRKKRFYYRMMAYYERLSGLLKQRSK